MQSCIHIYTYTCTYIHIYIYLHVYIHINIHTHTHTQCMYLYTRKLIAIYIYVYIHTHIHIYIYWYVYAYIYIHIHIHIHNVCIYTHVDPLQYTYISCIHTRVYKTRSHCSQLKAKWSINRWMYMYAHTWTHKLVSTHIHICKELLPNYRTRGDK